MCVRAQARLRADWQDLGIGRKHTRELYVWGWKGLGERFNNRGWPRVRRSFLLRTIPTHNPPSASLQRGAKLGLGRLSLSLSLPALYSVLLRLCCTCAQRRSFYIDVCVCRARAAISRSVVARIHFLAARFYGARDGCAQLACRYRAAAALLHTLLGEAKRVYTIGIIVEAIFWCAHILLVCAVRSHVWLMRFVALVLGLNFNGINQPFRFISYRKSGN